MSVIVKPTWTVDGWTGNTIDENGVHWFVRKDGGWFSPVGVRTSDIDRTTSHGTYSGDNLRTARVITLSGFAKAPTTALSDDAVDRFNGLLGGSGLYPLVVGENSRDLIAQVKLGDGTNLERLTPRRFDFQLVLIAPDPHKYGTELHQLPTGLATPAPGGVLWGGPAGITGVPWGGPAGTSGVVWQSGSGSTGTITLYNAGTADAPIELIVTSPAQDLPTPTITDTTSGRVIAYGGTVPQGSSLAIDTESGSVLLDGANRGPLLDQAEFFSIPAESSIDVRFSAGGPAPSATLLARWRDTYI